MRVEVAVIGGGPAGLAAALAARERGCSVLVLERDRKLGGILQQCIHNGFGLHRFGEELTGPEYAQRFLDRVATAGIEVQTEAMVLSLGADGRRIEAATPRGMLRVEAGATVLAMGCRERTRGALRIPGTRPAGVYTAGTAQRLVNLEGMLPGRRAVILGSGDIGLIMARRLVWQGVEVPMVLEALPYCGGLARNRVQCLDDYGIPLRLSHTVVRIHGRRRVEGVTAARVDANRQPVPGTEFFVPCDTLLLSVGLIPENELVAELPVTMDAITGGPRVDARRQTTLPGVFACGNTLQVHDLVDYVSEEAEIAGAAAAAFARGELGPAVGVPVRPGPGVRYVVPQLLDPRQGGTVYFRVDRPLRNAVVVATGAGEETARRRFRVLVPGEMQRIELPPHRHDGEICIASEGEG